MSSGSSASSVNDLSSVQNFPSFVPPSMLMGAPLGMPLQDSDPNGGNIGHAALQMQTMQAAQFAGFNPFSLFQMHPGLLPGPSTSTHIEQSPIPTTPGTPTLLQGQPVTPTGEAVPESPVPSSPSAPGPIRKRRFSSAKIQPTRIKKVMQSDEEIGRMVASVPVAIGRAMEHFAEKFLIAASAAVVGLNGRTLGPAHMKLAMLGNPHFHFLEPLLRDIGVPAKHANDIPYNVCQVPPPQLQAGPGMSIPTPIPIPVPAALPAPVASRRASNGQKERPDLAPGEKPKRGRPRKVKKEDRCIDDELANVPSERELMPPPALPMMMPKKNGVSVSPKNELTSQDSDRVLMPPPALPLPPSFRPALQHQNSQELGDTSAISK